MVKRGYEAQALAIIMIVLVISIVIGMAMFSRVLRDSQRVVSEKSSAEALETADSVLDRLKGVSVTTLKQTCSNAVYGGGLSSTVDCKAKGVTAVNNFLSDLGVGGDISASLNNCSSENLEVTVSLSDANDELEMPADSVRAFVLRGALPSPAACNLNMSFRSLGDNVAGVQISQIWGRTYSGGIPTDFETYGIDDVIQYCVHNQGVDCASNANFLDSWTPILGGSNVSVSLNRVLVAPLTYKYLDEVRVRAVGGSVAMKYSLSSSNCIPNTEMVKITASANCTNASRAKEVQIPQQDWASSIFDYVIFNGKGSLGVQ